MQDKRRSWQGILLILVCIPMAGAVAEEISLAFSASVGDGLAAVEAPIGSPADIAVDSTGAVFLADPLHTRVRKVSPSGSIATFAGGWTEFQAGALPEDGRQAFLAQPGGVAVGARDTVFVSDRTAHRVYVFAPDGTFLGSLHGWSDVGSLNYPADLVVDDVGNLYIADAGNHRVLKVLPDGTGATVFGWTTIETGGQPTSVEWEVPELLAYDTRNRCLWVADRFGSRLSRLRASGELDAREELRVPVRGIASDSEGNLYLAVSNHVLRRTGAGKFEIVAGRGSAGFGGDGGPAPEAELWGAAALVVRGKELFVLDRAGHRVRKVGLDGIITTIAGNGTAGRVGEEGAFANASGWSCTDVVEASDGTLYVSDTLNGRVVAIDVAGRIRTVLGPGALTLACARDEAEGSATQFGRPGPLALGGDGTLWVADIIAGQLWWKSWDGRIGSVPSGSCETPSARPRMFNDPVHLAVAGDGSVWVWDEGVDVLYRLDPFTDQCTPVPIPLPGGSGTEVPELDAAAGAGVVGLQSTSDGDVVVSLKRRSGERVAMLFRSDGQALGSAVGVPERPYRCSRSGRGIVRVGDQGKSVASPVSLGGGS